MKVLVADGDRKLTYWLVSKLQGAGYRCTQVDNGHDVLQALAREVFDVVVLDRLLPGQDGLQLLTQLQGRRHPPILMLSSLDQTEDRVAGLRAGAEDYLLKPFDVSELLARLDILVRRGRPAETQGRILSLGSLQMDVVSRVVSRDGQVLDLTEKEFKLLQVLLEHSGQVVSRTTLLQRVWGYEFDPQTNVIDVHMSKLRAKMDKRFNPPLLQTVRSVGYALAYVSR